MPIAARVQEQEKIIKNLMKKLKLAESRRNPIYKRIFCGEYPPETIKEIERIKKELREARKKYLDLMRGESRIRVSMAV
ncbi:MAG: hypothetical protein DRO11_05555, partial [Methanobacteriota archaeon]